MEWNENLKIGVKEIDDMHISLIDNVNEILRRLASSRTMPDYQKNMEAIKKEFVELFTYQESMMLMQKYSQYYQHKHHHEQFIDNFSSLYNQINADYFGYTAAQVENMINNWLMQHIFMYDKLWAKYSNEKN